MLNAIWDFMGFIGAENIILSQKVPSEKVPLDPNNPNLFIILNTI